MADQVLKFEEGSASVEALRAATAEAWQELQADPALKASAAQLGLNFDDLAPQERDPFDIAPASAGFAITGTAILIAVGAWAADVTATVTSEVILDVWRKLILPRIEDRFGSDAVGHEAEDE